MKLHLHTTTDLVLIRAVDDTGILIKEQRYTDAIALQPGGVITDWQPRSLIDITEQHIQSLAQFDPQVVLLGTGRSLSWPHASVLSALHSRQIGIEVMDTKAACRTYNVLASEGRQVIAALLPVTV